MTMTVSTIGDFDDVDDIEKMMTWEDVTIRPDDVQIKGRIGEGRFGTVHFAHYHGDAAVKFVNMDYLEEERRVEAFKTEVVSAYKVGNNWEFWRIFVLFRTAATTTLLFSLDTLRIRRRIGTRSSRTSTTTRRSTIGYTSLRKTLRIRGH